jgi:hypothetical protein
MAKISPEKLPYIMLTVFGIMWILTTFFSGQIGYVNDEFVFDFAFDFSNTLSIGQVLEAVIYTVVIIVLIRYLFAATSISSRSQMFAIVISSIVLWFVYQYVLGPNGFFPLDLFRTVSQSVVGYYP